jgi:hypothetical protein
VTFPDENLKLLVPFHIDGLVVGTLPADFQWTNLAADFSKLQRDYYFGSELAKPFESAGDLLGKGIHLHFRLPTAFTHGRQEGDEDPSFPAIPNRWLVQRFGGTRQLAYKAWIIKSDAEAEPTDLPGVIWPKFPEDAPVEFKSIGTCTELHGPFDEKNEPAGEEITAIGPGNPAFSAYYPACRSVLGFYDKLEGVSEGARLSYLVTGWYSTATDDPLHAFIADLQKRKQPNAESPLTWEAQLGELKAWLEDQRWACDSLNADDLPTRILCHGLVRGIEWKGPKKNYLQASDGQPSVFPLNPAEHREAYEVAVGNTSAEALAALLGGERYGSQIEDLLTALQADLFSNDVTASELPYELHGHRFGGVSGGRSFSIQPEPEGFQPLGVDPSQPPLPGDATQIPKPLQDLLRELNVKQEESDRLARKVADCRQQLYALWCLWTTELKKNLKSARWKALDGQLKTLKRILAEQKTLLRAADAETGLCKQRIETELDKYPKTLPDGTRKIRTDGTHERKYRLVQSVQPPFHQPNEPLIVVSGPAMARLGTYRQSGLIPCRVSRQEVTGFVLQVPGGAAVKVTGEDLFRELFGDQDVQVPQGIHRNLFYEALLLDKHNTSAIATSPSVGQEEKLKEIVSALQELDSTKAPDASNKLNGILPDRIGVFDWKRNPWIPLFLMWKVKWQSDYEAGPIAEDLVANRWTLAGNGADNSEVDLVLADAATHPTGSDNEFNYQGYSILTPHAFDALVKRLEDLSPAHPLINELKNRRILSQALDGFNEALIMQTKGLQLPPLDYMKYFTKNKRHFLDAIIDHLFQTNDTFHTTPDLKEPFYPAPGLQKPFYPIRSGLLQISRLSIVDAFGQTSEIPVHAIINTTSTSGTAGGKKFYRAKSCVVRFSRPENIVVLRPRFTQPVRLRFRWENASDHPERSSGPVCGWIIPNHLEKSLTVYSAAGKPLGALQRKLGLKSGTQARCFYWVDVPGGERGVLPPVGLDDTYEQLLGKYLPVIIKNIHLLYFCFYLLRLSADEGGTFSTLLNKALAAMDQRVPDEDPGVSVLVGRPLALVRASFQFEIHGLPAHKPELHTDASHDAPLEQLIETHEFEKAKWPLRLGDLHTRNDGLIGVFKCASSGPDGQTAAGPFYPAWGLDPERPVQGKIEKQDFTIDCVKPFQVTMLMDPQARIHATTGALPRTFIELSPADLAGAKRAREVFFQTAPVIGVSAMPHMPKPSDDYGEWSWAYRPDVTQWKLDPNIVEATDQGTFSETWPAISEGWLKLKIAPVKVLSFWVREGEEHVTEGTKVHLAWSIQGAESLTLRNHTKDALIKEWKAPPPLREWGVKVHETTTYKLFAYDNEGNEDSKELTITTVKIGA